MRKTFRQSMAWLHTWSGLLLGWVLFFIFLTGTLSYLRVEIDRWMMPEKPMISEILPARTLIPRALDHLSARAPDAEVWTIYLPERSIGYDLLLTWLNRSTDVNRRERLRMARLNPATGREHDIKVRDTGGGEHLYEMHFSLHYIPYEWAIRIVGICGAFMLVGIASGLVVHKKIVTDFFTFRHGTGQRGWLDAHNVLGVVALPFHVMITYSGLVLFLFAYMPAGPVLIYGHDAAGRFEDEVLGWAEPRSPDTPHAAQAPLAGMLDEVHRRWDLRQVRYVTVRKPGRANATVSFKAVGPDGVSFSRNTLTFSGATGELVYAGDQDLSAAAGISDALVSLHVAYAAGPLLRTLYVLSGLAGTALIGTGLVLWTVKRKAKLARVGTTHVGLAIVDRLNIGTIVGLPIAVAAYFWANRVLPIDLAQRHDWEVHVMFLTWAAMFIYPVWRPIGRAWVEMLAIASVGFGFIPVLNALTTDRHLGVTIPAGDWVLAGFDSIALAVGVVFAAVAWSRHRMGAPEPAGRRRQAIPQAGGI